MRKTNLLRLLLALLSLVAVAVVVVRLNLWNVSGVQPSGLYLQYKDMPGIQASFIKDKYINDSICIPVTLLQAEDSAAWVGLTEDVWPKDNYPSAEREIIMKMVDMTPVLIVGSPKGHLGLLPDTNYLNNDLVAVCKEKRTVSIFHIECESQINAIMKYHLKETKNSKVSLK